MPRKVLLQATRELMPVGLAECGWTAGFNSAAAQFLHEAAHCKLLADIVLRIKFAARMQRMAALAEHFGRQRYISRDDEIAGFDPLHDFTVRNIESGRHLQRPNEARRRCAQPGIGDQGLIDFQAIGGPKQDFLDRHGTGIRINPYLHALLFSIPQSNKYIEHCPQPAPWSHSSALGPERGAVMPKCV